MAKTEQAAPAKADNPKSISSLLKVAKAKKTLKSANQTLLSGYNAPSVAQVVVQAAQPQYSYQLVEPEVPK